MLPLSDALAAHDAEDRRLLADLTAAQAKADELQVELVDAQNLVDDLAGVRDALTADNDELAADRDALMIGRDVLLADRDALTAERDALKVRVAELEAQLKPPPSAPKTLYGACPSTGGTSLAAIDAMVAKYGVAPFGVARQFFGGKTDVAPRSPKVTRVHASWSLLLAEGDIVPPNLKVMFANLLPGDVVEHIHERNKKVTDGKITYEDAVRRCNLFYDVTKAVRPDLVVCNTLTGGALSSYGADQEERWGVIKADIVGVDCDGVHDSTSPLDIDYADEIANTITFMKKYGYKGWCVPEFGTSRPAFDTSGTMRAAWLTKFGKQFRDAVPPAEHVAVYDYESTVGNTLLPGSPEFYAWLAELTR